MNDGAVISIAKMEANDLERTLGKSLGKIHGDLPRRHDLLFAGLSDQQLGCNLEMTGNDALNAFDRQV